MGGGRAREGYSAGKGDEGRRQHRVSLIFCCVVHSVDFQQEIKLPLSLKSHFEQQV